MRWLGSIFAGGTPSKDRPEFWTDGTVPWLNSGAVNDWVITRASAHITEEALAASSARWIPEGSLVIALAGQGKTKGMCARLAIPSTCNQSMAAFTPGPRVDARFVQYWLTSNYERMRFMSGGDNRDGLNLQHVGDIDVPLPPLDVQRRIADFLDDQVHRLDNALALRQRQRELLEEWGQQTIRLGVAGAIAGGRPSGVPWIPALGEEAELRSLARTVTLQRGVDLTAEERQPGDVPVVTSGGVVGTHSAPVVDGPGVVVGRYGTGGSVYWIDGPHWPHNTTLYVRKYHGNAERWVYYLLKAFPFEMLQARAAVPGINRNDMAGVQMPWLPVTQQSEAVAAIDTSLDRLARLSDAVARQCSLLGERKRSLITAAVTGEFDVATASSRASEVVLSGAGGGL